MTTFAQLKAYTSELTTAVESLEQYCQKFESNTDGTGRKVPIPLIPPEVPSEVERARLSILATIDELRTLVAGPTDFLQHLAVQNQLLACIQWLGEFQVLACIPLTGSVLLHDLSDLAGVPESQLCRVVRMMATAGFLQEPMPGYVAHSTLSAPFVTKPSYLDAAMFLAEVAAPTALKMSLATKWFGHSKSPNESAYNIAFSTSATFASSCEQLPKLRRQWPAYLRYGTGDVDISTMEILSFLNQFVLDNACVVEVGAKSSESAMTLANCYPRVHFIVQLVGTSLASMRRVSTLGSNLHSMQHQPNPRLTIRQRTPGTPQDIHDAAVYILHLPSVSPEVSSNSLAAQITAELSVHVDVLRRRRCATLILIPHVLPGSGTVRADIESVTRLRDLFLLQLANEQEMEISELMTILDSMRDSTGRLVVVNKHYSRNNVGIALEVRYQPYENL